MSNSVADNNFFLFIQSNPDPVLADANFVFFKIPFHLFKISEIERIFTYKVFKNHLFYLRLDVPGEFRKLF